MRSLTLKTNLLIPFILLTIIVAACQPATPLPALTAAKDMEFTLAPDQTATLTDIGMTIRLIGVAGDQRCPSGMECAMSGPVSISLSAQMSSGVPTNIDLQTFTSNNGRASDMEFEGIKDRAVFEGYIIRVVSVLPYPDNLSKKIKDSEYRITLTVSKK